MLIPSKRRPTRRLFTLVLGMIALAIMYRPVERQIAAARLLMAMKSEDKSVPPEPGPLVEGLELSDGTLIRARSYGPPPQEARRAIVLGHGIHHKGIEEPRLIRFAQHLANLGCHVVTPELSDLADYRITERGVSVLHASVAALEVQSGTEVGLIGFSFAGGLAMLAAQDGQTHKRLAYVASVGGYHSLERSLRFLATNQVQGPRGTQPRKAHEYGLLVLLYGNVGQLELGDDASPFARALKAWLMEDRKLARQEASLLKGSRARELFELLEQQRLTELSPEILTLIERQADGLQRLSPQGHLSRIDTKKIFLHGADDSVVPPEETLFAEQELLHADRGDFHALVTPLLRHVGVDHPASATEKLKLVYLMSQLL